jgi:hypothetical protein
MIVKQPAVQVITVGHTMIVWAPNLPHLTSGILIGPALNVNKIVRCLQEVCVEDLLQKLGESNTIQ